MKLLFDNNLSNKLVDILDDIFPDSTHVMLEELDESEDQAIWEFAQKHGFTIITKDSNYNDLSIINGSPPKVVWLRIGNCRVSDIEKIIRENVQKLKDFFDDPNLDIIWFD